MIVCTKCQHQNPDTEKFCQRCGAFLEFSGKPTGPNPILPPPATASDPPTEWATSSGFEAPTTLPAPAPTGVQPGEAGVDRPYLAAPTEAAAALAPGEIACPNCGTGNPPTRAFCRKCGESLSAAPATTAAPVNPSAPADRRRILMIVGGIVAVIAVVAGAIVLFSGGGSSSKKAAPTTVATTAAPATTTDTAPTTAIAPTTVPVTVPPTFAPAGTTVCGTAYYAHPSNPALDGLFFLGQIYANCVGERGILVTADNYVIFPNGDDCPAPGGQGVMLIVFDQPTTVHTVRLEPSLAPIGNFRWPLEAEIVGYAAVVPSDQTLVGTAPNNQAMVRTSVKPDGAPVWSGVGTYDPSPGVNRLDAVTDNPTPVMAVELKFTKLGDSPGSHAKPNPGCAVHRIEVFSG
jgi:ribosomal protein L40E